MIASHVCRVETLEDRITPSITVFNAAGTAAIQQAQIGQQIRIEWPASTPAASIVLQSAGGGRTSLLMMPGRNWREFTIPNTPVWAGTLTITIGSLTTHISVVHSRGGGG